MHDSRNDMSIEDILQSIRNVINSKSDRKPIADDELKLTQVAPGSGSEAYSEKAFAKSHSEHMSHNCEQHQEDKSTTNPLLSEVTAAKTSAILQDFIDTAHNLSHHQNLHSNDPHKKTIEELVVEVLTPQLRNWLDNNLPQIVKQAVAEEIRGLVNKIGTK